MVNEIPNVIGEPIDLDGGGKDIIPQIPDGFNSGMIDPGSSDNDMFARANDLRVIQEYNKEENIPDDIKKVFWSASSPNVRLGFWEKDDLVDLFYHMNTILIGNIMSKPKKKYSFAEMNNMNQLFFKNYIDFRRGIGIEKFKNNERTLQAAMITQNIQGLGGSGGGGKKGGVLAGLRSIFS